MSSVLENRFVNRFRRMSLLPRTVFSAGIGLLVISTTRAGLSFLEGTAPEVILLDFVLVGTPGVALMYTGLWMPESEITRHHYPRIIAWVIGGVVVMYSFIVLRDLHPGVSAEWAIGTQALALTIGSIGGLVIGIQETKAAVRSDQLESRTQELEVREIELQRQNDQLEQFASVVSHDLRNPLSVAQGYVELLEEEVDSDHLDHVESAHNRMASLIDELLTLARTGQTIDETEPVDLNEIVETCWANVATGDATLKIGETASLSADRHRLQQALENLIRNALEHGGTPVECGLLDNGSGFYVEDDGPGISETDWEDIFEIGFTTDESGTGFGLAIVREIVEAHGWSITVTHGSAGGARFEVHGIELTQRAE